MMKAECRAIGLEPIASREVILLAPLPDFWQKFKASSEFTDGLDDPMDRYSKRVIKAIAERNGIEAAFPSDRPYPPFIKWALEAEDVFLSPTGLLVHKKFGLWISFRGALKVPTARVSKDQSPCEDCPKPCLTACPVGAFEGGEYDIERCKTHLRSGDVDCWQGCLARRSCPANHITRDPEQSEFHMKAFCS